MSLRPGIRRASSPAPPAPLAAVRALESLTVLEVDLSARAGLTVTPSLRAIRDAVEARLEVAVARQWAEGDLARLALVRAAVASLNARTYAASSLALNAPPF